MSSVYIRGNEINFAHRPEFFIQCMKGEWEPNSFKAIQQCVNDRTHFIDIGAWNGVLSLYAASLGAECYCLEPDMKAYYELLDNIMTNRQWIEQLHAYPLGIWNGNGRAYLNSRTEDGFGNSESSLIDRGEIKAKQGAIFLLLDFFISIAIEDYWKKELFIKMDVEGAEIEIIRRSWQFVQAWEPKMLVSFHPAWFKNKKFDIQSMIDILFPAYLIFSVNDLETIIDPDKFKTMLDSEHEHTFLLVGKRRNIKS